jgi:Zn-dependent protease with chaperone function
MMAALVLSGYALAVAWCLSAPLARLTRHGERARLGLAAWLTAMASVLTSAAIALSFLILAAVTGWSRLSEVVCRSVAGGACTPVVYRSALFELGLGIVAVLATLVVAVAAWSYGRNTQRAQRRSRAHAETARMAGRPLPGTCAVILDDPRPAAYCVGPRPSAIVLTTGALAVLDPAQVSAVLAHERAHLASRHHALILIVRGLAAVLPVVPLFARGAAEVTRLAEMSADDAAARASGRGTLATALLAIGTGAAIPSIGMAAAAYAVPARVERMLSPASTARRAGLGLALAGVLTLLILLPGALAALVG